jgi:hypothetical protein
MPDIQNLLILAAAARTGKLGHRKLPKVPDHDSIARFGTDAPSELDRVHLIYTTGLYDRMMHSPSFLRSIAIQVSAKREQRISIEVERLTKPKGTRAGVRDTSTRMPEKLCTEDTGIGN